MVEVFEQSVNKQMVWKYVLLNNFCGKILENDLKTLVCQTLESERVGSGFADFVFVYPHLLPI